MKRSLSVTNIRRKPILKNIDDIIRASKNNIILFGSVGNGKTFLLNKLCGTNYQCAEEGFSCTKDVQYSLSRVLDMVIIDFPGLNATKDFVHHLKVHKEALSSIPVRMICFVLKYSVRDDVFIREIEQMLEIFEEYTDNITIIITNCENIKPTRKENIKYILSNDFSLKNVIFTERETNGYALCRDLDIIQKNMKNIDNLKINSNDLAKNAPKRAAKEVMEKRKIFENAFNETLSIFRNKIKETKDNDLIKAYYFCFKDYKDILYDQYAEVLKTIKINGKELDESQIVSFVLQFSNKLYEDFSDFRKYVESKLEIKLNNYNGEFNKFKKCPYCGLVWFKVVGCDSVQCGKRTSNKDKIFGMYKNYKVSFINKQIVVELKDEGSNDKDLNYDEFYGLTEKEKEENILRKQKRMKEINPLWCGKVLSWSEMEDCSEEMIKKLQEDSLKDDYNSGFFNFYDKYE